MRRAWVLAGVVAIGCGGTAPPSRYEFESRFEAGQSGVDRADAIAVHVLILDLIDFIESLTGAIDRSEIAPAVAGDLVPQLEHFFSAPAADRSANAIRLGTDPAAMQTTYGELSTSVVLLDLLAGSDPEVGGTDWSTAFRGVSDESLAAHGGSIHTPVGLVRAIFGTVEANAIARAAGQSRLGPTGAELPVQVTDGSLNVAEVLEKLLVCAIAYHRAAEDSLDDDVDGRGLRSDATADIGGYTALEHAWDEAFGYFGAPIDYGQRDVASFVVNPARDLDMDARIDLLAEMTFDPAVMAAKRDAGSNGRARSTFAADAFAAFLAGRRLLVDAPAGAFTPSSSAVLAAHRDQVLAAWDAAIGATIVAEINEVLQLMAEFGSPAFDEERALELAGEFGELKGYALGVQFNRRSRLSAADFDRVHSLIGDAPVLPAAGPAMVETYRGSLREARGIVAVAYGFDQANVGDDEGRGGW